MTAQPQISSSLRLSPPPPVPGKFNYDITMVSPSLKLRNDKNILSKTQREKSDSTIKSSTNSSDNNDNSSWFHELYLSIPIFHPFGTFKRLWNFFIFLLLIYCCIEIPITFTINSHQIILLNVVASLIDICLFIDIILTFRTASFFKYDHLKLESNPIEIARLYIRNWFLIDLITSIPYQLFVHNIILMSLLRSLKLLRLFCVIPRLSSRISINGKRVTIFLEIFKLVSTILLIIHYTSCVWWFVGETSPHSWMDAENARDFNHFAKYTYSLYFAVTLKFIQATNIIEQWVTIIHTLIGTAILSYSIGTLSHIISKGDRIKLDKNIRIQEAESFCAQNRLPKEMSRAILTHLQYHCDYNYVFDKNRILDNIPTYLSNIVCKHISERVVNNLAFFKSLKSHVCGLIALSMKSVSCNTTHKLFRKGDNANKIYIQRTGYSVLCEGDNGNNRVSGRRGDVFGEHSFINTKYIYTLECNTWCEFYVINICDVINILKKEYPNKWEIKLKIIKKSIKNGGNKRYHADKQYINYKRNYQNNHTNFGASLLNLTFGSTRKVASLITPHPLAPVPIPLLTPKDTQSLVICDTYDVTDDTDANIDADADGDKPISIGMVSLQSRTNVQSDNAASDKIGAKTGRTNTNHEKTTGDEEKEIELASAFCFPSVDKHVQQQENNKYMQIPTKALSILISPAAPIPKTITKSKNKEKKKKVTFSISRTRTSTVPHIGDHRSTSLKLRNVLQTKNNNNKKNKMKRTKSQKRDMHLQKAAYKSAIQFGVPENQSLPEIDHEFSESYDMWWSD